jgi:hypothetical protein
MWIPRHPKSQKASFPETRESPDLAHRFQLYRHIHGAFASSGLQTSAQIYCTTGEPIHD